MMCPLRIFVVRLGEETGIGYIANCLKEECAWWGNNSQQCAMNKIGAELYVIGEVLEEIRDKMLHEKERLV